MISQIINHAEAYGPMVDLLKRTRLIKTLAYVKAFGQVQMKTCLYKFITTETKQCLPTEAEKGYLRIFKLTAT